MVSQYISSFNRRQVGCIRPVGFAVRRVFSVACAHTSYICIGVCSDRTTGGTYVESAYFGIIPGVALAVSGERKVPDNRESINSSRERRGGRGRSATLCAGVCLPLNQRRP